VRGTALPILDKAEGKAKNRDADGMQELLDNIVQAEFSRPRETEKSFR